MRRIRIMKYKIILYINRLKFWRKNPEGNNYVYEDD